MVLLLLVLASGVRAQDIDAEDGFAARITGERSNRGLGALTPMADLQAVARRHAQRMADRGEPHHNPALGSEVQGWSMVAENVGVGPDVDAIHQGFMESTTHRDNILNPQLTELGVGVVRTDDGRIWVVEVFRRPEAAAPPPPPPTTAPAPPPVPVPPPAPPPAPPAAGLPATAPPAVAATTPPATSAPLPPSPSPEAQLVASAATTARVTAPQGLPEDLAESVPAAASAAALLLAGVVGLQGQVLRRLGLVA